MRGLLVVVYLLIGIGFALSSTSADDKAPGTKFITLTVGWPIGVGVALGENIKTIREGPPQ